MKKAETNVLAIVAFVLSMLGIFTAGILAVPGLILGIMALNQINKGGYRESDRAYAIAAIAVGGFFALILLIALFASL